MKIKNIGKKIVNIGTTAILPGDTTEVNDKFAKSDIVSLFVEKEFIEVVKTKTKTKKDSNTKPEVSPPNDSGTGNGKNAAE